MATMYFEAHAGQMLDGARNSYSDVEVRIDRFTGLADLH